MDCNAFSSLIEHWSTVEDVGFVLVIVGVVGESVELVIKWIKRRKIESILAPEPAWELWLESVFFLMLVIGLALEFLGGMKAASFARKQSDCLNKELEITRKETGEANRLAGEASERAAKSGVEIEVLRSNNLVLQKQVLELKRELQWRELSATQKEAIVKSFGFGPRGLITISCQGSDPEAVEYTKQIADTLRIAGFGIDIQAGTLFFRSGTPYGLILFINPDNPSPDQLLIRKAFDSAGIPIQLTPGTSDQLDIIVGTKPR